SNGVLTAMTYDLLGRKQTSFGDYEVVIVGPFTFTSWLSKETWNFSKASNGSDVLAYTDRLNGVTTTHTTNTGKPRRVEKPDGTAEEYRYDLRGRTVEERFSDGGLLATTYSGLTTTKQRKDASGNVLATDTTVRDRRGNVVDHTDFVFSNWKTTYDDLDRV